MKKSEWFLLAFVAYLFWVCDVVLPLLFDTSRGGEYFVSIGVGLVIGQINLIAAWGALAPGKVVVRIPWAGFLAVVMWQAIAIGQNIAGGYLPEDRFFLGISICFGVVAAQIPLWIARRPLRWRLLPPRFELEKLSETDAQFNLKHMFWGMLLVSLALGLIRLTMPAINLRNTNFINELFPILSVAAVCNALVTAPCIWMAFSQRWRILWAIAWIPFAILVSLLEYAAMDLFAGPIGGSFWEYLLIFGLSNLSQCAVVFTMMVLLRAIGFRLVRADPATTSPAPSETVTP